ncbi:MAG: ROK family protein [Clostridia bacterium]|nr:ROK family protein [Clostridia bacterium]
MKIGIDMGGSHVAIGIVNENGKIIEKFEKDIKTVGDQAKAEISTYIIEIISKIKENHNIEKIGIGSPGTPRDGVLTNLINLKIKEFDISSILMEHFDIPVLLKNDAKCAGLAEKTYGALKEYQDAVFLCLGTGIGASVFMNGKELKPIQNPGMEIGHMVIDKNGIKCNCGKTGCFETLCSIKRLKDKLIDEMNLSKEVSSKELLEILKWRAKEENIKKILEEYIDNLNIGLSNIIDIFAPQAICLGGGFVYFEEILYKPFLEKYYNERKSFYKDRIPNIKLALLGNDAGIIGATI